MPRSYTEDEWMGIEPVHSPAIHEEHDPFDWDAYEKRQREEEAALWLERARHTIFPHLPCSVCGALTIHTLMTRDDNPTLEQDIARASATVKCRRHEWATSFSRSIAGWQTIPISSVYTGFWQ